MKYIILRTKDTKEFVDMIQTDNCSVLNVLFGTYDINEIKEMVDDGLVRFDVEFTNKEPKDVLN